MHIAKEGHVSCAEVPQVWNLNIRENSRGVSFSGFHPIFFLDVS